MSDRDGIYLWDVQASTPTPSGHPEWANLRLFVVCGEAERAMSMVRANYPECRFHQVIRRSSVGTTGDGVLVDPDVIVWADPTSVVRTVG